MDLLQTKRIYNQYVMPSYARQDVCFARGEGVYLWDTEGKKYIDFGSGIGVNSVGYAHPKWVAAIARQAEVLAHVSNLYYTEPGGLLAQKLCEVSGLSQVFFANSGAEANEGLIKLARKYSAGKYGPGRHTIVTLQGSFHGRTHTTLAATGQDVFHQHFQPLTEGFLHVPRGDMAALESLADSTGGRGICAVLLEPVQGEGGVYPLPKEYLQAISNLCRARDWLLLIDEVQTGIGRCGTWFGFQDAGIKPDALSFAKGIAGGLPLGGFIAGEKLRDALTPGFHATTFGGNPLVCATALATLDILEDELATVAQRGAYIKSQIESMSLSCVQEVRGRGLMLALSLNTDPKATQKALLQAGLVCLTAGSDALRLLPPLVITQSQLDEGLGIIQNVLN